MNETNRDAILNKVSVLFEKMHQNQKLQQLAEQNNLDIKNAIKLTDDNMMNVAVTLVALSLAKEANDPRYKKLVNTGLQKRSLKLEIINDYKKEANDIIQDYSSGNFNKEPIQEGFFDRFKKKPKTPETIEEIEDSYHIKFPEDFKQGYPALIGKYRKMSPNKPHKFTYNGKECKFFLSDYQYMIACMNGIQSYHGNEDLTIICTIIKNSHDYKNDSHIIYMDIKTGKYYMSDDVQLDQETNRLQLDSNHATFNNFEEFRDFIESNAE